MARSKTTLTALSDFGRTLRDEPAFGVYHHKVYLDLGTVVADDVHTWCKKRYVESKKGHLYRVVTYLHTNGQRYVDYVLLQTCTDKDELEIKLRWGFSKHKVARGERVPRRRLNKDQRVARDAIVAQALGEFYAQLARTPVLAED